ncbi:MAG: CCA tRNA nucleotidyltransferase [Candidatus Bathyarchaeota archaeon]|nr:CCA tRNA nucleotidyltransferase [Candidatus Bathyarchaeota archaeon]
MQPQTSQVTQRVLKKITPTQAERAKMEALAKSLEDKVALVCEQMGVVADVRVEGSVAKDTWLGGDPDVDVFMRVPRTVSRDELGDLTLKIARKAMEGARQVERYAEHPYLEAFTEDGTRVNIVPCYDATPGKWLSATDRTPFHTNYINTHLNEAQRGEVRLLKKFMKGIGVYGAEIKVGGFSGYLCELLVLHYGSFLEVLEAASGYAGRQLIDIESHYRQDEAELKRLFAEPLVIVDPVDKARNVASAVQPPKLNVFVAASRAFLQTPRETFFFPPKTQPLTTQKLQQTVENRGTDLVFVCCNKPEAVADVLWGQIYRTQKNLRRQLEIANFKVLRDAAWTSDAAALAVFVFELEEQVLPLVKKHLGPPLAREKASSRFLEKYANSSEVIAGPYLEEGRWAVQVHRKNAGAADLLRRKLADGGKDIGAAGLIAKSFRESLSVLVNTQITEVYKSDPGFAGFLTEFLRGKPFWLNIKSSPEPKPPTQKGERCR